MVHVKKHSFKMTFRILFQVSKTGVSWSWLPRSTVVDSRWGEERSFVGDYFRYRSTAALSTDLPTLLIPVAHKGNRRSRSRRLTDVPTLIGDLVTGGIARSSNSIPTFHSWSQPTTPSSLLSLALQVCVSTGSAGLSETCRKELHPSVMRRTNQIWCRLRPLLPDLRPLDSD